MVPYPVTSSRCAMPVYHIISYHACLQVPAREARPSTNDRQSLVVRPNPELIAWQPANAAEAADEIRRLNGLVTAIDEVSNR